MARLVFFLPFFAASEKGIEALTDGLAKMTESTDYTFLCDAAAQPIADQLKVYLGSIEQLKNVAKAKVGLSNLARDLCAGFADDDGMTEEDTKKLQTSVLQLVEQLGAEAISGESVLDLTESSKDDLNKFIQKHLASAGSENGMFPENTFTEFTAVADKILTKEAENKNNKYIGYALPFLHVIAGKDMSLTCDNKDLTTAAMQGLSDLLKFGINTWTGTKKTTESSGLDTVELASKMGSGMITKKIKRTLCATKPTEAKEADTKAAEAAEKAAAQELEIEEMEKKIAELEAEKEQAGSGAPAAEETTVTQETHQEPALRGQQAGNVVPETTGLKRSAGNESLEDMPSDKKVKTVDQGAPAAGEGSQAAPPA